MTEVEITALFDEWNNALQTRDPEQVANLYAGNAILLPTMSNRVRHTHEEIKDYFAHFLEKNPVVTINESNIRTFGQLAINSLAFIPSYSRMALLYRPGSHSYIVCIVIAGESLSTILHKCRNNAESGHLILVWQILPD